MAYVISIKYIHEWMNGWMDEWMYKQMDVDCPLKMFHMFSKKKKTTWSCWFIEAGKGVRTIPW